MGDEISDMAGSGGKRPGEYPDGAGNASGYSPGYIHGNPNMDGGLEAETDADAVNEFGMLHDAGGYFISCPNEDFYSCEEAIKRLNEYLDHELTADERLVVVKHLEICKPCLSRFTFEQTLIVSLRTKLSELCAPAPLKERLKALLRQSPPE
ncbi:MAG: zf-HC2 domain-containing protein [Capsulimonadaceae bacterium]